MSHCVRLFESSALLFATASVLSLSLLATQDVPVPPQLQPPVDEQLFLQLHATGDQIYACKSESSQFSWILRAPDAQLFDQKERPFGKHFAGPSVVSHK
jgi:Protein of unknown function (DUF3455)